MIAHGGLREQDVLVAALAALVHRHLAQDVVTIAVAADGVRRDVALALAGDLGMLSIARQVCAGAVLREGRDRVMMTVSPSGAETLEVAVDRSQDVWTVQVRLEGALLGPVSASAIAARFERLLRAWRAEPDAAVSKLSLLSPDEREQLVHGWNATDRDMPELSVVGLFRRQASLAPDRIAIVCEGTSLTYAELDRRSTQLAAVLRVTRVERGVCVGAFLDRSLDLVVALLAILKAGGTYVPLDITQPTQRLAQILGEARAKVIVADRSRQASIPPYDAPIVFADAWQQPAVDAPEAELDLDALAYIMFTSGSTGAPKGVEISHRALTNFLCSMQESPGFAASDILVAVTTISFDISGLELYLPLITGGRLVIATSRTTFDGGLLAKLLVDSGATVLQATPATWRMLFTAGWAGKRDLKALCGGEALPADLAEQLRTATASLWNMYGPTETTIWSTLEPVGHTPGPISIGRPIANTRCYVLDSSLEPVPVGVAGELFIGGAGVARGYAHRAALTEERFLADPFRPAERMYKTGDLARWLPEGRLQHLGRLDYQVKIRGFRIELGEIETVLATHEAVREVVVMARDFGPGDTRLVAYVTLAAGWSGGAGLQAILSRHLRERLPAYMVPAAFVTLDALPQTPNGKIDRKALPQPAGDAYQRAAYVAPRTATEQALVAIWGEVLSMADVGVHDKFFDVGGDSVLAVAVISRARRAFQTELKLRTMLEDATIETLANVVDAARAATVSRTALQPVPRASRDGALALSFAQERLWFHYRMEPTSPLYNETGVLELHGTLDIDALERSVQAIVARHEVLRSTFGTKDDRPIQRFAPSLQLDIRRIDLRSVPAAERNREATRRASEDARTPFDLERGPLIRATILGVGPTEHWLVVGIHHIVTDWSSLGIFWRELGAHYAAFAAGAQPALPALPIQYFDFAVWQRQQLSGAATDEQIRYWRQRLRGAPSLLELPTDRPRPRTQSFKGAVRSFELPAAVSAALHALSRAESATPFMTLVAAFQLLLNRYSGRTDIVVGSPVANRNREETAGSIGFFINTVALRTDLSGNPSFRELLARVRATALEAFAHQDVPFEKVVEELRPERSASYAPIVQVMFAYLQNRAGSIALPGLRHELVEIHSGTAKLDLLFLVEERDGGFRGALEYSTDLFDDVTIERLIAHYERLLAAVTADPDRRLSDLPIASDAQRAIAWHDAAPELAEIEAVLARHPDVREGAVGVRDTRLVGYVVGKTAGISLGEVRAFLAQHLPEHMVPPALVIVDALPRGADGGVDRRSLPALDLERSAAGSVFEVPATATEISVAQIWSEILGVADIGRHDSFFELGGHSLLAIKFVDRAARTLATTIEVRALFEHATLLEIARLIDQTAKRGSQRAITRVARDGGSYPASVTQTRFWFVEQLSSQLGRNHVPMRLRLEGALDRGALARAIDELVRRHKSLRTTFRSEGSQPLQQVIGAPSTGVMQTLDLGSLAPAAREARAEELAADEARRPHDLERGPMFRATLVVLDDTTYELLLTLHHLIHDGWSLGRALFPELEALYRAFASGEPSPLPEPRIDFVDYSIWETEHLASTATETIAWWKRRLEGAPPVLDLPVAKPRPARPSFKGAEVAFALAPELVARCRRLAQEENTTLFAVALAALNTLVCRYSGQEDIVIGTAVANRQREELERLIGCFMNHIPLRTDLSGDPSFRSVIRRVRDMVIESLSRQDIPLDRLVRELSPERDAGYNPLFQIVLVLQPPDFAVPQLAGVTTSLAAVAHAGNASQLDLLFNLEESSDGGIAGTVEYLVDLFDEPTVMALTDHLHTLLATAVDRPDERISNLPLA